MDLLQQLFPILLMLGLMYFMLFLPEKKIKAAFNKMISELKVNDEVVTRGGIVGKIVKIDEDNMTVETGSERTKIKFSKSAVASVRQSDAE